MICGGPGGDSTIAGTIGMNNVLSRLGELVESAGRLTDPADIAALAKSFLVAVAALDAEVARQLGTGAGEFARFTTFAGRAFYALSLLQEPEADAMWAVFRAGRLAVYYEDLVEAAQACDVSAGEVVAQVRPDGFWVGACRLRGDLSA